MREKILFFTVVALLIFPANSFAQQVPFANVPFNTANIPEPVPPPAAVRDFFDLDPYYQQWINVRGFPVLASAEVSPYALKEAAWLIWKMVGHRPAILRTMAEKRARYVIIPHNKHTSDMPDSETGRLGFFWDVRHRAVHCRGCPVSSDTEESLLNKSSSPIHHLGHLLQDWWLGWDGSSSLNNRVIALYNMAKAEGLYQNRYAGSTVAEYWAEGVGSWFNITSRHNIAPTRSALKKYDPRFAKVLTEVFGDGDWRYTPPATRTHLPHLQGFNPQQAPIYQRPARLLKLERQLKDPHSDGDGKWVNLEQHDPRELPRLLNSAAKNKSTRTDFIFGNLTRTDLTLYSVDTEGRKHLQYYSTTADFTAFDTHVGALYLIEDHRGSPLAVFRAEEEVGRVLIGGTPSQDVNTERVSAVPPKVVSIPDRNLAKAIRKALGLGANARLTDQALKRLTTLDARESQIKNLRGLEHATHLTELELYKNQIHDLSPLKGLTQLRVLGLDANQISNIRPLSDLTQLEGLYLGGNQLNDSDLKFLRKLKRLKWLALWQNQMGNITPLATLKKLEGVWLEHNKIRNVSPLAELVHLRTLKLAGNPIQDTSPLAKLTNLSEVDIDISREPSPPPPVAAMPDVNRDKKVNKTDLLLVVTALGESPPAIPNFDVNADGVINIVDVLLVIEALDDPGAAAAPSFGEAIPSLDPPRLALHLDLLRAENDGSLKYEQAIAFFQGLLAAIHPTETRLLANYPNPFNPETWIPYQLATSGEVTVRIYDVNGELVRTLALGHQPAGIYQIRSRAAYWDGRNQLGEPVASGLYFYTLTTGNFAQTRRMLILK